MAEVEPGRAEGIRRLALGRGLTVTLAPAAALLLLHLGAGAGLAALERWSTWVLTSGILAAVTGLGLPRWPSVARPLLSVVAAQAALGATAALVAVDAPQAPVAVLLVLASVAAAMYGWWAAPLPPALPTLGTAWADESAAVLRQRLGECRAAAIGALGTWLVAGPMGLAVPGLGQALVLAAMIYPVALGAVMIWRDTSVLRVRPWVLVGGWIALAVTTAIVGSGMPAVLAGLAAAVAGSLVLLQVPDSGGATGTGEAGWLAALADHPARLLVGSFIATCLVGGLVLSLPACSGRATAVRVLDAMFTSFSATCVTGLVVLDTPNDFSVLGQVVILLLIQIGGLGIMTFSAAALVFLRRRMRMRHEGAMVELVGSQGRGALADALRRMLLVTFGVEAAGAALLTGLFSAHGDGWGTAVWRAVFTAVSAYCNAGFALQTDNLVTYQHSSLVLHLVAALIVLGGLSPAVITEAPHFLRRHRLSLFTRVVLVTTGLLLFFPTLAIAALEWSTTLSGLSVGDRLANAWFQSVTTRTAGFNSIDLTAIRPATVTLMDVLMFIGGSPGGTAGGIKTTTVALLVLAVVAAFRGQHNASVWGWCIGHASVYKAATVLVLGLAAVLSSVLAIQLTQAMGFDVALFEVLSALGTVGLTIGGTPLLDGVGKVIIIACMFVGRVGPLTLLLSFQVDGQGDPWSLPEQEISVG